MIDKFSLNKFNGRKTKEQKQMNNLLIQQGAKNVLEASGITR